MLYYSYPTMTSSLNCPEGQREYGLIRYINDNATPPYIPVGTGPGCSKFIIAGSNQANTIAVRAQGSNIGLYVNQHLIWSRQDYTYRDGSIGILAKTFDPQRSSEVAFSDAMVWTLKEAMVGEATDF